MKSEIYEMGPKGLVRVDVPANSVKNNLAPGTVLYWGGNMGFAAEDFAVIKRLDFAGHGVMYDCIGLREYHAHRVEAFSIKNETDPSLWHSQHFFLTDSSLSADEIMDLIEKQKATALSAEEQRQAKAEHFRKTVAALRALHPDLVQLSETNRNSLTTAAKNIRKELAKKFPGVKFSVRSSRFAGGDSIDVDWWDGPTSEAVQAITNKYRGGSFDGMQDLYTYEHSPWTEVFGDAKYIMESRSLSRSVIEKAIANSGIQNVKIQGSDEYGYSALCENNSDDHWLRKAISDMDMTQA